MSGPPPTLRDLVALATPAGLTDLEKHTLAQYVAGHNLMEIAVEDGVTARAVRYRLDNAIRKLSDEYARRTKT